MADGISSLVAAMKNHPESQSIQLNACRALAICDIPQHIINQTLNSLDSSSIIKQSSTSSNMFQHVLADIHKPFLLNSSDQSIDQSMNRSTNPSINQLITEFLNFDTNQHLPSIESHTAGDTTTLTEDEQVRLMVALATQKYFNDKCWLTVVCLLIPRLEDLARRLADKFNFPVLHINQNKIEFRPLTNCLGLVQTVPKSDGGSSTVQIIKLVKCLTGFRDMMMHGVIDPAEINQELAAACLFATLALCSCVYQHEDACILFGHLIDDAMLKSAVEYFDAFTLSISKTNRHSTNQADPIYPNEQVMKHFLRVFGEKDVHEITIQREIASLKRLRICKMEHLNLLEKLVIDLIDLADRRDRSDPKDIQAGIPLINSVCISVSVDCNDIFSHTLSCIY